MGSRLTPAADLSGILPAVISGGRPGLSQRCIWRLLPALEGVTAAPVWVVREDQAADYEPDGHEVVTYGRDWAMEYAEPRWTDVMPYPGDGFTGAFPGREWACREAERRGCWAVLQLDDNIRALYCFSAYGASARSVALRGGLAMFADVLAAVTLATNARMTGAALGAANPSSEPTKFARAGFPYSLFLERTGEGRHEWFGPSEDDIIHGFQYGSDGTSGTAAIVIPLRYQKDHFAAGGLRGWYDQSRSAGLQRLHPEGAKITVHKRRANGRGTARVFHAMLPGAIKTPLIVRDRPRWEAAGQYLAELAEDAAEAIHRDAKARAARWAARPGAVRNG